MEAHRTRLACVTATLLIAAATGAPPAAGRQTEGAQPATRTGPSAPAGDLPVLRHHRYTMAGRVRPLLFWIGRDDVGMGEIVWRRGEGGVAYELLIGTDSAKAPRGINRWGYLLEDSRPTGTRVLGVMSTSDEATISDVTSRPAGAQQVGRFKGLDARIADGVSRSSTETIETERDFSVRDKELIVGRIEARLKTAAVRDVPVPDGMRPGFLTAVAELVDDTIEARRVGEPAMRRLKGRTIPYVYGRRLYDLKLTDVESLRASAGGPSRGPTVRAEFGTRNRSTGSRTTFELEYATDGPLAGVPTLIRHKPRWWLEAVLKLDERSAPAETRDAGASARR
jgi:hypothetical protein